MKRFLCWVFGHKWKGGEIDCSDHAMVAKITMKICKRCQRAARLRGMYRARTPLDRWLTDE